MKPFHKYARLGRSGDLLPWGNRLFGQGTDYPGYEIVDERDVQAAALVRDGSIVLEDPPALKGEAEAEAQAAAANKPDVKAEAPRELTAADKPDAKPLPPSPAKS